MRILYYTLLLLALCSKGFSQDGEEIRKKGTVPKKKPDAPPPANNNNNSALPTVKPAKKTLTGKIIDAETGEAMIGVYVQIQGTVEGATTDEKGQFKIAPSTPPPYTLTFSYVGYARQTLPLKGSETEITVKLKEESIMANEVVVSASRVSERYLETPVTIEKLDLQLIRDMPALNVYEAVLALKGVDQMSSSLNFRVINARGFNSTTNLRFVTRLDGMDMQAPGLNFPINVLNGPVDLDVEEAEMIPGAASALYGPNAFNGLLNITTKSPFKYPGLAASVKVGANHLDKINANPQPMVDAALRYARKINDKWAFKINAGYMRGRDWYASNGDDVADYSGTINRDSFPKGRANPGYDGLNIYGDEASAVFTTQDSLGPFQLLPYNMRISRDGYREQDLMDYNTFIAKGDFAVHFRPNGRWEWSYSSRFSTGTTVYQSVNRYAIKDFKYHVHKLEVNTKNFTARAYAGFEDAGNTYDSRFAGLNVNNSWKSNDQWFLQYLLAYSPSLNPLLNGFLATDGRDPISPLSDAEARAFANGNNNSLKDDAQPIVPVLLGILGLPATAADSLLDVFLGGQSRLVPGTPEFQAALDNVRSIPNFTQGAKFIDQTSLYNAEAQYNLQDQIKFAEIIVGGNYRSFRLNSQGRIFSDTLKPFWIHEGGLYLQATRRFIDKRLRVSLSARLDKNQNFPVQLSPRAMAVYTLGDKRNHNIRASFQTGFRTPSLQSQYINLDLGVARYVGGFEDALRVYGLVYDKAGEGRFVNAYTDSSVSVFRATGDPSKLVRPILQDIKPEQLRVIELGYKGFLFNRLVVDVAVHHNWYTDFNATIFLTGPQRSEVGTPNIELTPEDLLAGRYARYRRFYNTTATLTSYGLALGLQYSLSRKITLSGNYTYGDYRQNEEDRKRNVMIDWNTPRHKVNFSIAGREVVKNVGFMVTHKWNDAFFFVDGFGQGLVPAFNIIDAQASYRVPKIKTQFRIGASNLLNNRHIEAYGGPTLANLLYFMISYDEFLN